MSNTVSQTTPVEGVKMFKAQVFDGLATAPFGAVVIYRVEADSSLPLQNFHLVAFYDGNLEVVWGCGSTAEDAVEKAAQEWDNLLDSSPERENNPFREILGQKEGE